MEQYEHNPASLSKSKAALSLSIATAAVILAVLIALDRIGPTAGEAAIQRELYLRDPSKGVTTRMTLSVKSKQGFLVGTPIEVRLHEFKVTGSKEIFESSDYLRVDINLDYFEANYSTSVDPVNQTDSQTMIRFKDRPRQLHEKYHLLFQIPHTPNAKPVTPVEAKKLSLTAYSDSGMEGRRNLDYSPDMLVPPFKTETLTYATAGKKKFDIRIMVIDNKSTYTTIFLESTPALFQIAPLYLKTQLSIAKWALLVAILFGAPALYRFLDLILASIKKLK